MITKRRLAVSLYLIVFLNSFAAGRDALNFYEEIEHDSRSGAYIEAEKDADSDNYNFILGEGLIKYNEDWYSEYDVRKKYEENIKTEGEPDRDADGWETTFSLYKVLKPFSYKETEFYHDAGIVYFYDQLNDTGTITTNSERHEFRARYRLRFASDVGKGGSYSGFDFYTGPVHSVGDDGFHHELNFVNTTNLGYGFQNITVQYNEILDYDDYDSTYRPALENTFKWTYDFNENWAFSTELYFNLEKYCNGTKDDYNVEVSLIPYLLYDKMIKENFNVYAKIGALGYGVNEYRTDEETYNESGMYMNIILGFNYFW